MKLTLGILVKEMPACIICKKAKRCNMEGENGNGQFIEKGNVNTTESLSGCGEVDGQGEDVMEEPVSSDETILPQLERLMLDDQNQDNGFRDNASTLTAGGQPQVFSLSLQEQPRTVNCENEKCQFRGNDNVSTKEDRSRCARVNSQGEYVNENISTRETHSRYGEIHGQDGNGVTEEPASDEANLSQLERLPLHDQNQDAFRDSRDSLTSGGQLQVFSLGLKQQPGNVDSENGDNLFNDNDNVNTLESQVRSGEIEGRDEVLTEGSVASGERSLPQLERLPRHGQHQDNIVRHNEDPLTADLQSPGLQSQIESISEYEEVVQLVANEDNTSIKETNHARIRESGGIYAPEEDFNILDERHPTEVLDNSSSDETSSDESSSDRSNQFEANDFVALHEESEHAEGQPEQLQTCELSVCNYYHCPFHLAVNLINLNN